MAHRADSVGWRINADFLWRFHIALDECCHLAIESRREQHRLVFFCDVTQHPLDLRHETLIGHSVCFVKHDHFNIAQVCFTVFHQVD